jgi:cyclic-di-GMP phosphodiesterase TipF (flagellum assembly factor)
MGRDQQSTQMFVMAAMGLVTGAVTAAMYRHGGFPGPVAATAAVAIYVLLLTIHALIWRSGGRRGRTTASNPGADARATENRKRREGYSEGVQAHVSSIRAGTQGPDRRTMDGRPFAPPPAAPARPGPSAQEDTLLLREAVAPRPAPRRDEPVLSPAAHALMQGEPSPQAMHDYWSFRPAAPRLELPPFVTGRAPASVPEPALPGAAALDTAAPPQQSAAPKPPVAASPRESDVEMIQDAIKRLLQEVNTAEMQGGAGAAGKGDANAKPQARAGGLPNPVPASVQQDGALDGSIEALRLAAQTMRAATLPLTSAPQRPQTAPPAPAAPELPAWAPVPGTSTSVRAIAGAIMAGRIDVALEPIMSLEDQRTRHYEVSIRLRNEAGEPLNPNGEGIELRGTGLLPLFDCANVTRTAAMARRLEERGKPGSLFSAFNGESLTDDRFLGGLAETLHQRASFATQLILAFTQSDVRDFAPSEWDTLADMRSLGFRFALSGVTDLDMDFEDLAESGFTFVKLDAEVFLKGLATSGGHIPASDVCRHLAKLGLTLVVEHIDNEEKLARVFGFGVLLGQGHLFGGPRPVRSLAVATSDEAAA